MAQKKLDLEPVEDTKPTTLQLEPVKDEPSADELIAQAKLSLDPPTNFGEHTNEPPPEQGWLSRAWHAISEPLTDAPSRLGNRFADSVDSPSLDRSPTMASIEGFGAGALQGIGNLLSGLTSPLNIATTALTAGSGLAGKAGLEGIAEALSLGSKIAAAPTMAHGAIETLHPNSTMMERGMGLAELAGGGAAMMHSPQGNLKGIASDVVNPVESNIPSIESEFGEPIPRMPTPDSLNPEFDARRQAMIDDTARMQRERENAPRNIEREDSNSEWMRRQHNSARYEGRNTNDAVTPLTPNQQIINDSFNKIRAHSDEYSSWFAEQEAKLPESEFFEPPPEIKAKYESEKAALEDAHDKLVNKLDPLEQAPLPDINIPARNFGNQVSGEISAPNEAGIPSFGQLKTIGKDIVNPDTGEMIEPLSNVRSFEDGSLKKTNKDLMDRMANLTPEDFQELERMSIRDENKSWDYTPGAKPRKGVITLGDPEGRGIPESEYSQSKVDTGSLIKMGEATPETVKQKISEGYKFSGLDNEGNFKFDKVDGPTNPPILESEIGTNSPTESNSRKHIGSLVDTKKSSVVAETLNFPRAVMASTDMSAPLRQGIGLIHKKQFWTAVPEMFKAWGSEAAFDAIQQSIAEKPLFKDRLINGKVKPSFAKEAGLHLTDLTDLSNREESLMSTWAEKIPGVRASNRAYTAFLNKLRADTFESLVQSGKVFGADANVNTPLARSIADFVNTSTGRGSLGKLEQSAVALNSTFFAPRLIASRLKMLNPHYYITADPFVRKEALKSLLAIAGTGNALGQLAKMSGLGSVESNPTSSDFGKIKVGSVRIDPFAGFQQYIVAASRLISGKTKSSTSGHEYNLGDKFGRQTRLDVAGRFAESKLNPALSFATGILRGKDFTGQPFNVPEQVASRFIPIFLQDLKQLATENPNLIPGFDPKAYSNFHPENLPYAVPSWFGMGVQQYGKQ